jgi:hypothetical protein
MLVVFGLLAWQFVALAPPAAAASCSVNAHDPVTLEVRNIHGEARGRCDGSASMTWKVCIERKVPQKPTSWFTWGCRGPQVGQVGILLGVVHLEPCIVGESYLVRTFSVFRALNASGNQIARDEDRSDLAGVWLTCRA